MKRFEIKFILNSHEVFQLKEALISKTTFKKTYDPRYVNSLYFDDINNMSAADNLSGISKRKKYRLRWYGKHLIDQIKFEIKNRKNKIGYKEYYDFSEDPETLKKLRLSDIAKMLERKLELEKKVFTPPLFPRLQLDYLREYYENSAGIRLTIDNQIRFWPAYEFSSIFYGAPLSYDKEIVELKFSKELYPNAVNFIRNTKLLPKRHSKYLIGLAKLGEAKYI